jgi:hypothetical protein
MVLGDCDSVCGGEFAEVGDTFVGRAIQRASKRGVQESWIANSGCAACLLKDKLMELENEYPVQPDDLCHLVLFRQGLEGLPIPFEKCLAAGNSLGVAHGRRQSQATILDAQSKNIAGMAVQQRLRFLVRDESELTINDLNFEQSHGRLVSHAIISRSDASPTLAP